MLGCFNLILGKIWTIPAIGLHFYITFLTQSLSLSMFYPKLGQNNPVYMCAHLITLNPLTLCECGVCTECHIRTDSMGALHDWRMASWDCCVTRAEFALKTWWRKIRCQKKYAFNAIDMYSGIYFMSNGVCAYRDKGPSVL